MDDEKKKGSILNLIRGVRKIQVGHNCQPYLAPNICNTGPDVFWRNSALTRMLDGRLNQIRSALVPSSTISLQAEVKDAFSPIRMVSDDKQAKSAH